MSLYLILVTFTFGQSIENQSKILNIIINEESLVSGDGVYFNKRESECIYLLFLGKTAKEIARHLNISSRTVEVYLNNIRLKLGCYMRAEVIARILSNKENKQAILKFIALL